jgi:hypothetical protein
MRGVDVRDRSQRQRVTSHSRRICPRLAGVVTGWVIRLPESKKVHRAQAECQQGPAEDPKIDLITTEVGPATAATGGLLRKLRAAWPPAQLVLTASHDSTHAVAAARAGAAAWVYRESSLEHLLEVLRGVPLSYAFYPPRELGAVLRELRDDVQRARHCSARLDVLSHASAMCCCAWWTANQSARSPPSLWCP